MEFAGNTGSSITGLSEKNEANREFMKSRSFAAVMRESDQAKGLPVPPHGIERGGAKTTLPEFTANTLKEPSYVELLKLRRSQRDYTPNPISQQQLSFLLWSMYSVQDYRGATRAHTLRLVPSGGARHSFEIYFVALNIEGLKPGLYHYLPLDDVGIARATIEYIGVRPDDDTILRMMVGQEWALKAGALFFISTIPYRGEWRYDWLAHRMLMTDLGYVGQNFMLSCAALGLGSCQVAGYDQELCDQIFGLDGADEFFLIAMPVGTTAA